MSDFVLNIEKYAEMATEKPQDFGYWGNSDMFDTWGFTNIDQNRDSDPLEKANFKYITEELMGLFPEDYRIETYNHWAVGSVDRLVCRVYEDDTDKKVIASSFYLAMEWLDKLDDYPVADEDTYNKMIDDDNIDSIDFWNYLNPGYVDIDNNPDWASEVYHELDINMGVDVRYSGFKDDDILMAIYQLQIWSPELFMEWYAFCDQNGLERPPFTANEISKYDKSQPVLEFE
jgi:hypothetical protein